MKTTMTSRVRGVAALAGIFVSLGLAPVVSGQSKESSDVPIPLIQLADVPLDAAIENLARQADLNFILSPGIPNRDITERWENLSAKAALTKLLAENKLFLVESPATSVAQISATNRIESPVDPKWIAADTNNVIPLMQFQSVPLDAALANLAQTAGPGIVVDPTLGKAPLPDLSVRWKNLKPRQAIAAICENYNLVLAKDAQTGGVRITRK